MKGFKKVAELYMRVRKSNKNILLFITVCLMMLSMLNLYGAYSNSKQLTEFSNTLEDSRKLEEWNIIEAKLLSTYYTMQENSRFLSQELESDIMRRYSDLNILKAQFEEENLDQKFYNILQDNLGQGTLLNSIYRTNSNILVGTYDGILATFTTDYRSNEKNHTGGIISDWEHLVERLPNEKLAREAINAILFQNKKLIFLQVSKSPNGDLEENIGMNTNTLKKAFFAYGLEGLKHYSLVSPAFITETGDIFNINDRYYMKDNKNYKLIVTQTLNAYDIVYESYHSIVSHNNTTIKDLLFIDELNRSLTFSSIIFSVFLVVLAIIIAGIYNTVIHRKTNERDE